MTDRTIRALVVAPFEPVRVGLRDGFADPSTGIEVIGEFTSLVEMVNDPAFSKADVLLVDAAVLNGENAAVYPQLLAQLPDLSVLFFGSPVEAASISPDTLAWVSRLSCAGFLYRDGTISRVVEAVRLVAGGVFVCEIDVISRLFAEFSATTRREPVLLEGGEHLSPRESQVLRLVADGLSNKEIGARLFLSEGTVKAHVSHVMAKLGLQGRAALVRYAFSHGVADVA